MRAHVWRRCAQAAWFGVPPLAFVRDRWLWVYCVEGRSMDPTLNPQDTFLNTCFHDWVLVHRNAEFQKGDIVVLRDPGTNGRIVRRLVAREHEIVVGAMVATALFQQAIAGWRATTLDSVRTRGLLVLCQWASSMRSSSRWSGLSGVHVVWMARGQTFKSIDVVGHVVLAAAKQDNNDPNHYGVLR
eukprot:CAMPEP_0179098944 /NCGR_PEP_ID=MMETSP0796-20121207/45622_1 /TAXON_ID=73915 /ORGANISM="Pyrodinium bahamense, Strain pbaha01" /LENGTH=185 /DNA_ID=CAMNT_0020796733 /DNA_START=22 /DNA_END=577 /DNA_ORIENTATION=+